MLANYLPKLSVPLLAPNEKGKTFVHKVLANATVQLHILMN